METINSFKIKRYPYAKLVAHLELGDSINEELCNQLVSGFTWNFQLMCVYSLGFIRDLQIPDFTERYYDDAYELLIYIIETANLSLEIIKEICTFKQNQGVYDYKSDDYFIPELGSILKMFPILNINQNLSD